MGTYKLPSASTSPTSSEGSSRSRRSPRNARRSPDRDWDKVPSPPRRIHSPGGTSRSPRPLTQRAWRRKYGSASPSIPEELADEAGGQRQISPVSDAPSKELLDGWDRWGDESFDDSSSDGSIGSNIVVASRRMTSGPRMTRAQEDRIRQLLDHENIDLHGDDWVALEDTPDEHLINPGTLESLIRARQNGLNFLTDKKPFALPEMLCWHVLRSLLRVVYYLHTGSHDFNDNHVNPNWQPIVHNHINPTNIWFHPRHTDRRTFKVCKLRNFSRCVVLPGPWRPHDSANETIVGDRREAFAGAGNRRVESGYEAPEFWDPAELHVPSPACDLWSIGAVMVSMMTTRTIWDLALEKDFIESSNRPRRRRDVLPHRWRKVQISSRVRMFKRIGSGKLTKMLPEHYGIHLRMVVDALLSYDPLERGSTRDVWRNVEELYTERRRQLDCGTATAALSNILT